MKRTIPVGMLLVLALAAMMFHSKGLELVTGSDRIEYLGESILLAKPEPGAGQLDDDTISIDPSEQARVERLVSNAPIGTDFTGRWDLITGVSNLAFPAHGHRQFGEKLQPDGSVLSGWGIEIPLSDKMRILTFRGQNGHYHLIDDFIDDAGPWVDPKWPPGIASVAEEGGQLVYCTMEGKRVATRPAQRN